MEYFIAGSFVSIASYIMYKAFKKDKIEDELFTIIKPLNPVKLTPQKQIRHKTTQTDPIFYSPMKVVENLSPQTKYYFVPNKNPCKKRS